MKAAAFRPGHGPHTAGRTLPGFRAAFPAAVLVDPIHDPAGVHDRFVVAHCLDPIMSARAIARTGPKFTVLKVGS